MFASFSDVEKYTEKEKVEQLDLKYVDLNGRWHHVTLPASADSYALLKEGVGFDGSSVGYAKTHLSDMKLLIPDLSTGMIDPFWERKTLSFICEVAEADSRQPYMVKNKFLFTSSERQSAARMLNGALAAFLGVCSGQRG